MIRPFRILLIIAAIGLASPSLAARPAAVKAAGSSASTWCEHASKLRRARQFQAADSVAALAVALATRGGPDSALVLARALAARGWIAADRNERIPAQVQAWAETALAIRLSRLAPGHPDRRDAVRLMGNLTLENERNDEALEWFHREVAEVRAMSPPDTQAVAAAMTGVASTVYRLGRFQAAATMLDSVIALYDAQAVLDSVYLANALNGRSSSLWQAGDLDAAERDDERALELRLALGPRYLAETAQTVTNIGSKRFARGDYEGALEYHRRAVEYFRLARGPDTPAAAWSLGSMGFDFNALSRWAEARDVIQQAVALLERERGPQHSMVAAQLIPMVEVQLHQGDHEGALVTAKRIHETRTATLAADHPLQADAHDQFGGVYMAMRRFREARAHYDTAITLRERGFGMENPKTGNSLGLRAGASLALGDTAAAIEDYRRKLTCFAKGRGPGHPQAATARLRLALLDVHGDSARVLPEMRAALDSIARANGPDYPELGQWRTLIARSMNERGDVRGTIAQGLESERIRRGHFRLVVNALGEHDALNAPPRSDSGWDLAARLAVRSGLPAEQDALFDALVRSRAEWLDELAERRRAAGGAGSGDPAVAALARQFAERCSELSKRALAGAGDTPAAAFAARLALLQARRDSAEQRLAAASPVHARIRTRRAIGAREALAALPRGAALVSYVRAGPEYLAYVVTPGALRGTWLSLGAAERVDALVTSWRATIRPGAAANAGWAEGSRLRAVLWTPVARRLGGVAEVYVVPDGELLRVPFAALPGEDGVPLVERGPLLRMLGCERDLIAEPIAVPAPLRLAIGGPDFAHSGLAGADSSRAQLPGVASKGLRFAPLPGAAVEAAEVASLWRSGAPQGEVRELVGAAASESAFRLLAPLARVLHVATHGFFLDQRSESGTGLRGIGGLAPPLADTTAAPRAVVYASPLVRSGLALAGANGIEAATDGQDDGVLTADEIATLDLRSVDCAVLSACQTGDGEIVASEGVLGLSRAFRIAGARSLVASLWPVDDAATREWMVAFHRARDRFMGDSARAAREATRLTRRARLARGQSDSPFYWAAFTAQGR